MKIKQLIPISNEYAVLATDNYDYKHVFSCVPVFPENRLYNEYRLFNELKAQYVGVQ